MIRDLLKALQPLVAIADAYDANELGEARPALNEATARPPSRIDLYSDRDGKTLLTLEDCLAARQAVQRHNSTPYPRNPWRLEIHEEVTQKRNGELATTTKPCSAFKVVAIKGDKKVVLFQNSQYDAWHCIIRGTREKYLEEAQAKAVEINGIFNVPLCLTPKRHPSEIEKLEVEIAEALDKLAALKLAATKDPNR